MLLADLITLLKTTPARVSVEDVWFVTTAWSSDGRGPTVCVGAFGHVEQATRESRGQGTMGSDASVRHVPSTIVFEVDGAKYAVFAADVHPVRSMSSEELAAHKQALAQRALAKLTAEEREALGLG